MSEVVLAPDIIGFIGPQGCGKSTALRSALGASALMGEGYAAFVPKSDIRNVGIQPRGVVVDDLERQHCTPIESLDDISEAVIRHYQAETVFIDELSLFERDREGRAVPRGTFSALVDRLGSYGVRKVVFAALNAFANETVPSMVTEAQAIGADMQGLHSFCEYPANGIGNKRCGEPAYGSQMFLWSDGEETALIPGTLPDVFPQDPYGDMAFRGICRRHRKLPPNLMRNYRAPANHQTTE